MKYYLIKMNANYAGEFDVNGFVAMTEKEYEQSLKHTIKALESFFAKPEGTYEGKLTVEQFNKGRGRYTYATIDGKYREVTYEDYLANPSQIGQLLFPRTYERYFGTNEALQWESVQDYLSSLEITEISQEEYNTIDKLFGEYGTIFFPLDNDEYEEDDDDI